VVSGAKGGEEAPGLANQKPNGEKKKKGIGKTKGDAARSSVTNGTQKRKGERGRLSDKGPTQSTGRRGRKTQLLKRERNSKQFLDLTERKGNWKQRGGEEGANANTKVFR